MGVDRKTIFMIYVIAGSLTVTVNAVASAEEIYKSVDKSGKVTYSAAPQTDAVLMKKLAPPQQPTPEEVNAAEEQYHLIKAFGAEWEKNRKQREEALARKATEERAQQNAGLIAIVYVPFPVFVAPVHPVSHFKSRFFLVRPHARRQM